MAIEYVKDSFPTYLGLKSKISASDVKNFLKSPRYYYYQKYERVKKSSEDERHFIVGSALHEMVLEPNEFNKHYVVSPKFDRRTSEGKKSYEDFLQEAGDRAVLTEDEIDIINKVADSVIRSKGAGELIGNSYKELSIYTKDEESGLNIRLRPDIYPKTMSTIADLKTCINSSPRGFKSDVYSYGYGITAAFYMDFAKRENYVFIACEKIAPYQVSLFVLADDIIDHARKQYRMALDLLKWSYEKNYWCNYVEFEILQECYELGNLDQFFDIKDNFGAQISIIK